MQHTGDANTNQPKSCLHKTRASHAIINDTNVHVYNLPYELPPIALTMQIRRVNICANFILQLHYLHTTQNTTHYTA